MGSAAAAATAGGPASDPASAAGRPTLDVAGLTLLLDAASDGEVPPDRVVSSSGIEATDAVGRTALVGGPITGAQGAKQSSG